MIGSDIIIEGAKHLGLINSTRDGIQSNKLLNQNDLLIDLRVAYSKAYVPYKKKFPDKCIQTAFGHNWEDSSVVSVSSTGYTLITNDSIFDNGNVGCYVYNETLDELGTIESYTSPTTVTLDIEIANTWDGHTVYLLTGRIPFVGELEDVLDVQAFSLRRELTDPEYYSLEKSSKSEVRESNTSFQSALKNSKPCFYISPMQIDDEGDLPLVQGLQALPIPLKRITRGYCIEYLGDPNRISLTNSPVFPRDHHFFLSYGIAAIAGKGYGLSDESIEGFWKEFNSGLRDLLYSQNSNTGVAFKPSRLVYRYSRLRKYNGR